MTSFEKIVRVKVGGRVQGVGFRAFVQCHAEARRVAGWVRNRSNGDVEAVLAGSENAVTELCTLCRRGPRQALVERFEIVDADEAALAEADGVGGFHQLATF